MNVSQNWMMNDIEITLRRGFFRFQESIRHHTPLRCGGPCFAWIEVFDLKELQKVLRFLRKVKLKYRIHHPFEDWVVHDSGFSGAIIRLRGNFEGCQQVSEKRSQDGELLCQRGLRIGVSTLWCQIETSPWKEIFSDWTGSVGGVLRGSQNICLRGWEYTLEIYKGKKVNYEYINKKTQLRNLSPTEIITHIILHQPPRRKNSIAQPLRNGELFLKKQGNNLHQRRCGELLEVQDLYGTRLRGWKVESYGGLITHVPYQKESGESTYQHASSDLLELYKGFREKIQRRMGIEIVLASTTIGSAKK